MPWAGLQPVPLGPRDNASGSVSIYRVPAGCPWLHDIFSGCVDEGGSKRLQLLFQAALSHPEGGKGDLLFAKAGTVALES